MNNLRKFRLNKLARDKIIELCLQENVQAIYHILDDQTYRQELLRKLQEETQEALHAATAQELHEELADIVEVIKSLAQATGCTPEKLEQLRQAKKEARGGFAERLFIAELHIPEGHHLIKHYQEEPERYPEIIDAN